MNREQLLAQLTDAEECAKECRECGVDDSYYEDHASFLRREIMNLDRSKP